MCSNYFTRIRLAILLLVLFSLLSSGQLLREARRLKPLPAGQDEISLYERRFNSLREVLPKRGIVCYVSDQQTEPGGTSADRTRDFYLSQYALSPLIVISGAECKLLVVNRTKPGHGMLIPNPLLGDEYLLVRDCGNGIMLFRREKN